MREDSLSVIIPTKDPDPTPLARTIDAIGDQTYPVEEVLVVDSSAEPIRVRSDKVDTRVLHRPDLAVGEARRVGLNETNSEYVAHFDEDAVALKDTYFEEAISRLQQPDVSAVGGTVFPLRGNASGRAIAFLDRFNPSSLSTRNIVHRRALCADGGCLFPGQGRGEDITLRRELKQYGRIERMTNQAVLKDLPTTRQGLARDLIVGTVTGAVAGAISGWARDNLSDLGRAALREADEDLR